MSINNIFKVTGKNIEAGTNFRIYNSKKLDIIFKKYSKKIFSSNTILEKRANFFKVKLNIKLNNRVSFETLGRSKIANKALDLAVNNISKRIRRYSRKLKNHRQIENNCKSVKKDLIKFHFSYR